MRRRELHARVPTQPRRRNHAGRDSDDGARASELPAPPVRAQQLHKL
jgi:hypothetical protein